MTDQLSFSSSSHRDFNHEAKEFVYLGGLISQDGSCTTDVKRRIALASAVFGKLNRLWKSKRQRCVCYSLNWSYLLTYLLSNVYTCKDVRNISHSSFHAWIWVPDPKKRKRSRNELVNKNLGITRLHRMRNEDMRNRLQQEVTLTDRIRRNDSVGSAM